LIGAVVLGVVAFLRVSAVLFLVLFVFIRHLLRLLSIRTGQ
jgi:hypothetical protein